MPVTRVVFVEKAGEMAGASAGGLVTLCLEGVACAWRAFGDYEYSAKLSADRGFVARDVAEQLAKLLLSGGSSENVTM